MISLLRNRNFILVLALTLGLLWGRGAQWTEPLTLPVLVLVMTLATMGVPGSAFRSFRSFVWQALAGIAMNYFLQGTFLIALSELLIRDETVRVGFVLLAAVPPAVAVVPFSIFLNGDDTLSLIGMIGAYLGALIFAPLIVVGYLGSAHFDLFKLMVIMVELIFVPMVAARILVKIGMESRIDRYKGTMTNWSFGVLCYTIVGLNREVILRQPIFLLPVVFIAVASTFLLGWGIEAAGRVFHVPREKVVSLVLLGTLKNYGLAAGLALALFSKESALPATVSAVFMIVYVIWLEFKSRWTGPADPNQP
jgi:bile acid:Na+ symporter, BASS family